MEDNVEIALMTLYAVFIFTVALAALVFRSVVMPKVVVIDGSIGVGKSTVVKALAHCLGDGVVALEEPVDEWKNWEGRNLLEERYLATCGSNLLFQLVVLMTRCKAWKEAYAKACSNGTKYVLCERHPWLDRAVFAEAQLDPAEMAVYRHVYDTLTRKLPDASLFVWLSAGPAECYSRCCSRKRTEEKNVDLGFFKKHCALYERACSSPELPARVGAIVNVVDASAPAKDVLTSVVALLGVAG